MLIYTKRKRDGRKYLGAPSFILGLKCVKCRYGTRSRTANERADNWKESKVGGTCSYSQELPLLGLRELSCREAVQYTYKSVQQLGMRAFNMVPHGVLLTPVLRLSTEVSNLSLETIRLKLKVAFVSDKPRGCRGKASMGRPISRPRGQSP